MAGFKTNDMVVILSLDELKKDTDEIIKLVYVYLRDTLKVEVNEYTKLTLGKTLINHVMTYVIANTTGSHTTSLNINDDVLKVMQVSVSMQWYLDKALKLFYNVFDFTGEQLIIVDAAIIGSNIQTILYRVRS